MAVLALSAGRELVLCAVLSAQRAEPDRTASQERIDALADRYATVRKGCVRCGDITTKPLQCAHEEAAELIAVGRRHRPLQHTLYRGRSIGELVAAVDLPLLVIPVNSCSS